MGSDTLRRSDRQRLLMGQAVLQIHRRAGREYMPEGASARRPYRADADDASQDSANPPQHRKGPSLASYSHSIVAGGLLLMS
jgi:hypothetical protein